MPYLTSPVLPAGTFAERPQPALPTGDGLILRPWSVEDAPAVHAAFRDPVLRQWHMRGAASEDEVRSWIAEWRSGWTEERDAQWAVVDADTDRLKGRVALRAIELADGTAEVAYWTVASARGQGVAARATTALARWALDEIGFHRLELLHSVRNEASCRVAAKTGFALEGTKRGALLHEDGWHDMHLHARVRGD
ncbi:GNAT family N-acetyltransferase [Streptomyces poonensis]|uniref:Acetyltransferase n=1 Tax=Streptomyces poonensis TaxID=68255 RepID=A0A918PHT6_9ACTN|nr:GNAT family N-acetyltransferase [Streptomyces poonensis]GGZ07582.1 acetyltransferase [Streptomyces poonensis]GLJ88534.1 acetyltransferase [Streptomyces poonensis]